MTAAAAARQHLANAKVYVGKGEQNYGRAVEEILAAREADPQLKLPGDRPRAREVERLRRGTRALAPEWRVSPPPVRQGDDRGRIPLAERR
jgi:hypothetical protein